MSHAASLAPSVSLLPEKSLLVDRARDFLSSGPVDATLLVERVCQIPGVPRLVAEHMAETLFGSRPEFARDADGRWALADRLAPAPGAPTSGASVTGAAALPPGSLRELSYVVVDVETTGGRANGGDRITEIAAVLVRGGAIAAVYETLVNPQRSIPPWITALTNISWDMVRDKPTFGQICPDVVAALEGHIFVAHNASFDWAFVSAEIARATGRQLDGRRLCTVRLARKLLPQLRRRSLDHLTRHYGVEIGARHRAAGDAVATAQVLLRLLDEAEHHGCRTWPELEMFLAAAPRKRRPRRATRAFPLPADGDEAP